LFPQLENINTNRSQISKLFLLLASSIFIFLFAIVAINTFLVAVGYSVSKWSIIISFFTTNLILLFPLRKYFPKRVIHILIIIDAILCFLFLFSISYAGNLYDLGYDGQSYHQEAIIHLASGWNPFREKIETTHSLWINHYPKSPYLLGAAVYCLTGNIEAGKGFNILLIVATLFLSLAMLTQFENIKMKSVIMLSIAFSFNPVSVFQANSYYFDGQIASLLTSLVFVFAFIYTRTDMLKLLLCAIIIILLINIKFSSFAYSLIFVLGFVLLLIVLKHKSTLKYFTLLISCSYIIGIFGVGYNPYITNLKYEGNPFYPLAGKNKVDIVSSNLPADLYGKNRFEKLLLTTFAKPENYVGNMSTLKFKAPFILDVNELKIFTPDIRIGGFGILWTTIVAITIILLVALLMSKVKSMPYFIHLNFILVVVFVSVIINPECWWARYAPQLWMIPVFVCFVTYFFKKSFVKLLGTLLLLVLCLNIAAGMYTSFYYSNIYSIDLRNTLSGLAKTGRTYEIYFGNYKSNILRFRNAGIKFIEIQSEKKNNPECEWGIVKIYRADEK
jgi:hypothetical protein